jgi:hypothetical protein
MYLNIKNIMDKTAGWITRQAEFIPCGWHEHTKSEIIKQLNLDNDVLLWYEKQKEDLEEGYKSKLEWAKREGNCNAEWHTYEIANDNFRYELVEKIYESGLIRVGFFKNEIHLECTTYAYINLKDYMETLKEEALLENIHFEVEFRQIDRDRKESLKIRVVKIDRIEIHPNANTLEIVYFKEFQCIVKKGEYKTGDTVVYFPVGCRISEVVANKLGIARYLKNGEVKAINLKQQKSQGIVIKNENNLDAGMDLTDYYLSDNITERYANGKQQVC